MSPGIVYSVSYKNCGVCGAEGALHVPNTTCDLVCTACGACSAWEGQWVSDENCDGFWAHSVVKRKSVYERKNYAKRLLEELEGYNPLPEGKDLDTVRAGVERHHASSISKFRRRLKEIGLSRLYPRAVSILVQLGWLEPLALTRNQHECFFKAFADFAVMHPKRGKNLSGYNFVIQMMLKVFYGVDARSHLFLDVLTPARLDTAGKVLATVKKLKSRMSAMRSRARPLETARYPEGPRVLMKEGRGVTSFRGGSGVMKAGFKRGARGGVAVSGRLSAYARRDRWAKRQSAEDLRTAELREKENLSVSEWGRTIGGEVYLAPPSRMARPR